MDSLCPNSLKIGAGDDDGGTATLLRSRGKFVEVDSDSLFSYGIF